MGSLWGADRSNESRRKAPWLMQRRWLASLPPKLKRQSDPAWSKGRKGPEPRSKAPSRGSSDGKNPPGPLLGFSFIIKPGGVYYLAEKSDGGIDQEWLCSPLSVLALTRDSDGGDWGRLLEVEDPDGVRHRWAMPMSMTAGGGEEYRAKLKAMGLRLAPGNQGKNRLDLFINLSRPETRARCVSRIGLAWWPVRSSGCGVRPGPRGRGCFPGHGN